ncbi:MAG: carbohydrate-binding family 9-like protein [Paludibacter sp.]
MKTLFINYASELDNTDIYQVAEYFDSNQMFEYIDMLNWATQFPYKPVCRFKIARSSNSLFIHFKVIEKNIRALYSTDQQSVWEDSCVEFFCKQPGQDHYFNFEFNCIGTCLATKRKGRELDVQPLSEQKMKSIIRFASLGNEPFDEKSGNIEWELTVEIPFDVIEIPHGNLPETLRANFYKCGDGTSVPHYLSWSHITTDKPDFHRPELFGELSF